MSPSEQQVLRTIQEYGEATRPQLAVATGLSLVTVNQAVAKLTRGGHLEECGSIPSGGGRPVQLYRFNKHRAYHVLLHIQREGRTLHAQLEEIDLQGSPICHLEGRFAYLDKESFDGWIDSIRHRHRIRSIVLSTGAEILHEELVQHLHARYNCPVHTPSIAAMLAVQHKQSISLCLPDGAPASCAYIHHGHLHECSHLATLPLPCPWEEIPLHDSSMQEEAAARLIQILSCILSPSTIHIHSSAWSPKLVERIRYNASIKLRGKLPGLRFSVLSEDYFQQALRAYAINIPHT